MEYMLSTLEVKAGGLEAVDIEFKASLDHIRFLKTQRQIHK